MAEVLAIREDQIDRYGGAQGLRDASGLEAALLRPQTGYCADLIEEAAALWESLAQNHPFVCCRGQQDSRRAGFLSGSDKRRRPRRLGIALWERPCTE